MDSDPTPPEPGAPAGAKTIRAFLFDTYGTVCDFYRPLSAAFAALASAKGVACDAGRLAIAWRGAYVRVTAMEALTEKPFRPLVEIHRENLVGLLEAEFPAPVTDAEIDATVEVWNRLDPWPDAVAGLTALREMALVAPLSNGNFRDMAALARHARLPWDAIVGSSVARSYKPHPRIYLESAAVLDLLPQEVCMVAAHQADLRFAAGHGMQTAFVRRPDEFGGPVKPKEGQPGADAFDAAEIHAEEAWTYVADDFLDLAAQHRRRLAATGA